MLEHLLIKLGHEYRGFLVIHLPQTHHDPRGAGIHKATRQSDETFAADFLSQSRFTGAENNKVGGKIEVVDVLQR